MLLVKLTKTLDFMAFLSTTRLFKTVNKLLCYFVN